MLDDKTCNCDVPDRSPYHVQPGMYTCLNCGRIIPTPDARRPPPPPPPSSGEGVTSEDEAKEGSTSPIDDSEQSEHGEKKRRGRAAEMAKAAPTRRAYRSIFMVLILTMSASAYSLYLQLSDLEEREDNGDGNDGEDGTDGNNGTDGNHGLNGLTSLLLLVVIEAGDDCPNGGVNISTGLDDNRNSVLDIDEVDASQFLCHGSDGNSGNSSNGSSGNNGSDGSNGISTLSEIISLPIGNSTCPNGGIEIHMGRDSNVNGILDSDEIDEIEFVCNGIDGSDSSGHAALMTTMAAPPTFCVDGMMLRFGLDDGDGGGKADDGILNWGEADEVFTICSGSTAWSAAHPDAMTGVLNSFSSGCSEKLSFESKLLFTTIDTDGCELWISDGTIAGTEQIVDINSAGDSAPAFNSGLFSALGKVWFDADDGNSGRELWLSDGTTLGTKMVADINVGASGSQPALSGGMAIHEGKVWFNADDGVNGRELWSSDGTPEGTKMMADICAGSCSSSAGVSGLIAFNGSLWFSADDGTNGTELWRYSSDGVEQISEINSADSANPAQYGGFAIFADRLWFDADDGINGRELWSANESGASMLADLANGPASSMAGKATGLIVLGDNLVFRAEDSSNPGAGNTLWASDGTSGGTAPLSPSLYDIAPTGSNVFLNQGLLWFACQSAAAGEEICSTDGTSAGTQIYDLIAGAAGEMSPSSITVAHGWLYFAGEGFSGMDATGVELWRMPLEGGVAELSWDVYAGDGNNANIGLYGGLTTVENTIFFSADDGTNGHELFHWGQLDTTAPDVFYIS